VARRPAPQRAAHPRHAAVLRGPFSRPDRSPARELLANVAALREACLARGVPIRYNGPAGPDDRAERGLLHDVWGPGMTSDDAERAIVAPLAPPSPDAIVTKSRYSAFHRPPWRRRCASWPATS